MYNNSNSQISLTGCYISVTLMSVFKMRIGKLKFLYFTDNQYI